MATRSSRQPLSSIALNAIRLLYPEKPIRAAILTFDLTLFHALLDRPSPDVFVTRYGDSEMAIIPIRPDADLTRPAVDLPANDNIRLFAALAREAVFRHLVAIPGNYRVVQRRPPTVETAKYENVIPTSVGLPDWMKKRAVLIFQTRIVKHPAEDPYVVLTCATRLRTVIDVDCGELHRLGVPLAGRPVLPRPLDLHQREIPDLVPGSSRQCAPRCFNVGACSIATKPPVSVTPIPLGDRLRVAGPVETSPPVAEENTIDLRRNLA